MQHFYPNLFIAAVCQPLKRVRRDTRSSGEDSVHTINVTCTFILTNAENQALTELFNFKQNLNNSEMEKISQNLNLPAYGIKVNNMSKSIICLRYYAYS